MTLRYLWGIGNLYTHAFGFMSGCGGAIVARLAESMRCSSFEGCLHAPSRYEHQFFQLIDDMQEILLGYTKERTCYLYYGV